MGASEFVEGTLQKKTSRREFLRGSLKVAVTAGIAGLVGQSVMEGEGNQAFAEELSPEELKKNNIRIFQTNHTSLHINKSALELPLFRDAKEGKTGDVAIVLVDDSTISWKAIQNLDEEPRIVAEAVFVNPLEKSEESWQRDIDDISLDLKLWKASETYDRDKLEKIKNGSFGQELAEKIAMAEKKLNDPYAGEKDVRFWTSRKEYHVGLLNGLDDGSTLKVVQKDIERDLEMIKKTQDRLSILNDPEARVEAQLSNSEAAGAFVRPNDIDIHEPTEEEKAKFPEITEKFERYQRLMLGWPNLSENNYIFVAVGGDRVPKPSQILSPGIFEEIPYLDETTKNYQYRYKTPPWAGKTLRHEISHYESPTSTNREYQADTNAYMSVIDTWRRSLNGEELDKSPFIFVNEFGITYARNKQDYTNNSPKTG